MSEGDSKKKTSEQKAKEMEKKKSYFVVTIKKSSVADAIQLIMRLIQIYPNFIRDISDFQFDRPIGKGGFGQVWLAQDLRTGKLCAIKELHSDNLTGRNMSSFAREINAMIKVRGRFVLPFIGFTIEPPYSIISEYIPNGCLFNYVNVTRRKQALSGTHNTIIALAVAWAMANIHKQLIVYRDLKAANILLDKNYMPMICDFGISRYIQKNSHMTRRVGTISHMAPEVIFSNNYGFKCDIYSYAFLLYEMIEGHNPYRGTVQEIIQKVKDEERPEFYSPDVLPCLKELIERCWDNDPNKRPSFTEIYELFKTGQVFFNGTDINTVKKFCEDLDNEAKKQVKYEYPPITMDIDSMLQRLQRQYDKAKAIEDQQELERKKKAENEEGADEPEEATDIKNNESKEVDEFEKLASLSVESEEVNPTIVLQDPSNLQFIPTLDYLTKTITVKQFNSFYSLLFNHFRDADNNNALCAIMEKFCELIDRDEKFIDCFDREHFFTALPLNSKETLNYSFHFVNKIFDHRPDLISRKFFRALGSFMLKIPEKALSLFSLFAMKFNEVDDPFMIFDFLIDYARAFINIDCGSVYIDILYYLTTNYEEFKKLRLNKIKPILYAFCKSKNWLVAHAAVCALANLYDETFQTPFNAMCRNILDHDLAKPTISVLLRTETYPASRVFMRVLANALPMSSTVILKFAAQSLDTAKIVAFNNRWMSYSSSNSSKLNFTLFKIFLVVFTHHECREILQKQPTFPSFIADYASSTDPTILTALGSCLKRFTINQYEVERLASALVFRNLFTSISKCENQTARSSINSLLDSLARKSAINDFQLFIPYLMKLLPMRNSNTAEAITVLVTFSCHKHLAAILKNTDLVQYFKSLSQTQSYSKSASVFLSNIDKV